MSESASATKLTAPVATLDAARSSGAIRIFCYMLAAALVALTVSGMLVLTAVSR